MICLLFWLALPDNPLTGLLLILAAALQLLRLSRWGGARTLKDPLVPILHIGYLCILTGLLLLGLSIAGLDVPRSAAIHALTAGAMTTMILAVMTRATLGHTGRALKASDGTVVLYICVTAAALLRVGASLGLGSYPLLMDISGLAWVGSFDSLPGDLRADALAGPRGLARQVDGSSGLSCLIGSIPLKRPIVI